MKNKNVVNFLQKCFVYVIQILKDKSNVSDSNKKKKILYFFREPKLYFRRSPYYPHCKNDIDEMTCILKVEKNI